MSSWDPTTYGRFQAERRRPVDDLIARLPRPDYASIADLGCGGGQSTAPLAESFPTATIIGYDNSEPMLATARASLPGLTFLRADIANWSDPSAELVFSNAALQWVPGHISVMARLASELPTGGCLAAQFPDNLDEPIPRQIGRAGGGTRADWRVFSLRRGAGATLRPYRHLANHLCPSAGKSGGDRFLGRRFRVATFSGAAERRGALRISGPLRRGDRQGIPSATLGRGSVAVSQAVRRRGSPELTPR